ncbi:MAG: hypothetical protein ABEK75_12720 [Salinibacter sp.]
MKGNDGPLHVAVIADLGDDRLNAVQPALARATEEANLELDE